MTQTTEKPNWEVDDHQRLRRLRLRYVILTLAVFLPLIWASFTHNYWYPVHSFRMFYGASALGRGDGRVYYVFRGETSSGESVDIPPITIINALDDRIWTMVDAVVANESFQLRSPHPENVRLIQSVGGIENVPRAALLPNVLRVFGERYNASLSGNSPQRLVRVRLDAYQWREKEYGNYAEYLESWRVEL